MVVQRIGFNIFNVIKIIKIYFLKRYGLKIGTGCFISNSVFIDPSFLHLIEIGNNVTITADVKILAHDSSTKKLIGYTRIGKVRISDNVFIGMGSIILPNVIVGKYSIIGSGSVVTKDIPNNVVAAGNPARIICSTDVFLKKHLELLKISPLFDEDFTIKKNLTKSLRREMDNRLANNQGYII